MDAVDVATRLVQPRDDDDLVTGTEPMERVHRPGVNLQPSIGSALVTLLRGVRTAAELRANDAYHLQAIVDPVVHVATTITLATKTATDTMLTLSTPAAAVQPTAGLKADHECR